MIRVALVVMLLSGCTSYQFGDITKSLITARNIYCTATNDQQRQAAKAKLEAMGINTGDQSICAWTVEVLIDKARGG